MAKKIPLLLVLGLVLAIALTDVAEAAKPVKDADPIIIDVPGGTFEINTLPKDAFAQYDSDVAPMWTENTYTFWQTDNVSTSQTAIDNWAYGNGKCWCYETVNLNYTWTPLTQRSDAIMSGATAGVWDGSYPSKYCTSISAKQTLTVSSPATEISIDIGGVGVGFGIGNATYEWSTQYYSGAGIYSCKYNWSAGAHCSRMTGISVIGETGFTFGTETISPIAIMTFNIRVI